MENYQAQVKKIQTFKTIKKIIWESLTRFVMSENFCLRWNDHHDTFFSSAEKLCHSSLLTDVVLSAGGTLFQAHKLVLSVCSKFFQDVFAQPQAVPQAHNTVIYLKDVESHHLQLLLSYMYRGQVDVEEHELGGFLKTATGLQIKGLSDDQSGQVLKSPEKRARPTSSQAGSTRPLSQNDGVIQAAAVAAAAQPQSQFPPTPAHLPAPPIKSLSPVRRREEDQMPVSKKIKEEEDIIPESLPVVQQQLLGETNDAGSRQVKEFREEEVMEDLSYHSQGFLEPHEPDMWRMSEERLNKAYPCQYCGMSFAQNWLLKRHWKTHTGDKPFKCTICNRTFSLRDSCVRHLRTVHKELVVSDDVSGLVEDLGGGGNHLGGGGNHLTGGGGGGANPDQGLGISFEPALSP